MRADREPLARTVFGQPEGAGSSELLRAASPTTDASAVEPPFLLVHGDRDGVVPVTQSLAMTLRLNDAGGSAEFVVVHNAEHGLAPLDGPTDPPISDVDERIADFLDEALAEADKTRRRAQLGLSCAPPPKGDCAVCR